MRLHQKEVKLFNHTVRFLLLNQDWVYLTPKRFNSRLNIRLNNERVKGIVGHLGNMLLCSLVDR